MRVCIPTTSFPRHMGDDAAVFVRYLVEELHECGVQGELVVPKDTAEETLTSVGAILIRRFRYGVFMPGAVAFGAGIMPNIRARRGLLLQVPGFLSCMAAAIVRSSRGCDVIHAQWIVSGVAALPAAIMRKLPLVVTVRGEDLRLFRNPCLRPILGVALRCADCITTVGESVAEELRACCPQFAAKMRVIHNGVASRVADRQQIEEVRARYGFVDGQRSLLAIGSIVPRKNFSAAIELLAALKDASFTLLIAGRQDDQGEVARLLRAAEMRGVKDRVKLLGLVPPEDIPALLSIATAFVSTSQFEGRPNAMLEALAHGCVVIASDIPAHREVVMHGETGILFSLEDLGQSAADVSALLADEVRMRKIATPVAGTAVVRSWRVCAEEYVEVYREVVK